MIDEWQFSKFHVKENNKSQKGRSFMNDCTLCPKGWDDLRILSFLFFVEACKFTEPLSLGKL